jgi:O-glycosyl hydrolase
MVGLVMRLCCCSAFLLDRALAGDVEYWMTSKSTSDRLTQQQQLSSSPGMNSNAQTIVNVDVGSIHQQILGFGGAITQSSATVFKQLPSDLQNSFLDAYYGENGIGYSTGTVGWLHYQAFDKL